jgi:4-hydroxybenzoate polyprenyltransferase
MADRQMTSTPSNPWLAYVRERYPVAVYVLLSSGYVLSGWAVSHNTLSPLGVIYGMACFMLFFFTLRLMDELKDYDKDVIAHPERPLPRGLLSRDQARRGIGVSMGAMLALSALGAALFSPLCGGMYLLVSAYLWLMYKEFYIGQRLQQFPMVYAVTHQIINIPMVYFGISIFDAAVLGGDTAKAASLIVLGAFFCYEVCRKLDPDAHPLLKTYLAVYGRPRTILIVICAEAAAAYGACWIANGNLIVASPFWAFEALVLASFVLPKDKYKLTETLATLSLALHVLGLPILRAIGVFQP